MYLYMARYKDNTDLCELIRRNVEQIVDDRHIHVLPSLGLKIARAILKAMANAMSQTDNF